MTGSWTCDEAGVVVLPTGRIVRGRALRQPLPFGPAPEFAVYLLGSEPQPVLWPRLWLRWRDFDLPAYADALRAALADAWSRSATQRVEIACRGGCGRTGTALACLAIIDGVPNGDAVDFVRERYDRRAVETPWQRRFVTRFAQQVPLRGVPQVVPATGQDRRRCPIRRLRHEAL